MKGPKYTPQEILNKCLARAQSAMLETRGDIPILKKQLYEIIKLARETKSKEDDPNLYYQNGKGWQ